MQAKAVAKAVIEAGEEMVLKSHFEAKNNLLNAYVELFIDSANVSTFI